MQIQIEVSLLQAWLASEKYTWAVLPRVSELHLPHQSVSVGQKQPVWDMPPRIGADQVSTEGLAGKKHQLHLNLRVFQRIAKLQAEGYAL